MIADMVMDIIRTRRERRIQKAVEKAIAEARPQILAEARGRILAECATWNRRRLDAAARGESFDEPFPYSGDGQGKDGSG